MLDIYFGNSGGEYLKYYESDTEHHYSYAINTFDYPTVHRHVDYWEFCIVTEGTVRNCAVGKPPVLCPAKHVFLSTTEECHSLLKATKAVRYINISVRESHILGILNAISPTLGERISKGPTLFPISDGLLADIERLLYQCNLLSAEQVEQKNGLLCSSVLLLLQELNRIHLNVNTHLSPFMKRLLAAEEKREFIGYTAKDLVRELNYSPAHLNRLFKQHFNLTPYEYLQRCRMRFARNLLQNTDMTVQKIAAEVGYSNLSHFLVNFKRHYGVTAGEYRKRSRMSTNE